MREARDILGDDVVPVGERLIAEDLLDPKLIDEVDAALGELAEILNLPADLL